MDVIAIGRPNENMPEIGSSRLYIEDHEWQEKVSKLIEKATLVLIRPSNSEGLIWELEYCFKYEYYEKLILSTKVGNMDSKAVRKARYNTFRKRFSNLTNIDLPEYRITTNYIAFDELKRPIECEKGSDVLD
jgi:hypothetical protein